MVETKEKPKKANITNKKEKKSGKIQIKDTVTFIQRNKKKITVVLIGALIVAVALSVLFDNDRSVTTIAESSLKEVIETSELSTVEFIYNSTATVNDDKNNPKYHIAYEGTVKAGFDFNKITTEIDKENKKIVIVIPKIKINSVNINDETLDFIFVKDKYDTETTFQEAYKMSYSDLENKAKSNETIKKMAYENAVDSMKAIVMPLESKLPEGYVFDFREESESK